QQYVPEGEARNNLKFEADSDFDPNDYAGAGDAGGAWERMLATMLAMPLAGMLGGGAWGADDGVKAGAGDAWGADTATPVAAW
ncbi:ATP-dependent RNA helicase, partial [Fusarium circinatum]